MSGTEKQLRMGLGEALRRLLDVEIRFRNGLATPELKSERDMLLVALNRVEIQLGFDCDGDASDTVEIFKQTSETSCCRIIDLPNVHPVKPRLEVAPSRLAEPTKPITPVKSAGPGFFSKIFAGNSEEKK